MTSTYKSLLDDKRIDADWVIPSEGAEPSAQLIKMFGHNADITTEEDLTEAGGDYPFPTSAQVLNVVSDSAQDSKTSAPATGTITVDDYAQMSPVQPTGSLTVVDWEEARGLFAQGTLQVINWALAKAAKSYGTIRYGAATDGDTVTVDSTVFTKVTGIAGADEFTNEQELTDLINALATVRATLEGDTITVEALDAGVAGDLIEMETTGEKIFLSGATLENGRDPLEITVNGVVYVADTDFAAVTSNEVTAQNIANAVNDADVTSRRSGAEVVIDADAIGAAGNSIDMETTLAGAVSVSGATLSGGQDPLTITIGTTDLVEGTDFNAEASNSVTAHRIADAITASGESVSATAADGVVSIVGTYALGSQETGNSLALESDNTDAATVSGATLSGGEDGQTLTIGAVTFVAGTDFTPVTSNNATAAAIAAAINANADVLVTASAALAVVTLTAKTDGTAGNSIALTRSDSDSASVSGATLSGGANASTTGAFTVLITGLDEDYEVITETIELDGTTPVTTTAEFLRVNKAEVVTAGAGGVNAGVITIENDTDTDVLAQIETGNNETQMAVYTVPAGFTVFARSPFSNLLAALDAVVTVSLLARPFGEIFHLIRTFSGQYSEGNTGAPYVFEEKTDIKLRATTDTASSDVAAGFDLLLVQN